MDSLDHAKSIGYSEQDLAGIPEGVVCHGCGNPAALAELKDGETVLDLGSGGGLDAFLAARRVGPTGKVIGIDSSAETVARVTDIAAKGNYANIVFRQGEMGELPLGDQSVDVVISNCVLNYAGDKLAAFKEVFRCLKPNGRMVVADLVAEGGFSDEALKDNVWGEWLRRAFGRKQYLNTIEEAGFKDVAVVEETTFPMAESDERLRGRIVSLAVKACKASG
jgi:arsenite methyltransferase